MSRVVGWLVYSNDDTASRALAAHADAAYGVHKSNCDVQFDVKFTVIAGPFNSLGEMWWGNAC